MILKLGTRDGLDIVTGIPGDNLSSILKECILLYNRVILSFNGMERVISKGSNLESLYKYWFDPRYNNIEEDRDSKISEIIE